MAGIGATERSRQLKTCIMRKRIVRSDTGRPNEGRRLVYVDGNVCKTNWITILVRERIEAEQCVTSTRDTCVTVGKGNIIHPAVKRSFVPSRACKAAAAVFSHSLISLSRCLSIQRQILLDLVEVQALRRL